MKSIEVPSTDKRLRKIISELQNETVLLTEEGKPVAALVDIAGMDAESLSLGTNAKFLRILRKSFKELDKGQRISLVELRKRAKR